MPRGQKSKLRAREKRRQGRDDPQPVQDAQAAAAEDEERPCCSSSLTLDAVPSTSAAGSPQKPQGAPPTSNAAARVPGRRAGKGAKSREEGGASTSGAPPATVSPQKDLLLRKAGMLMQYLIYKYKMKEPILKSEMLKMINKRLREQFPEILKRASERLELVFGLELKQVKPRGNTYTFVSKLDFSSDGSLSSDLGFPTTGLLIPLLGVIFLNGSRASEQEIWEFLNMLGVYDGITHFIFGDPRKLITQDLVREKYLEYKQVPNSDPPTYEFLWGPRAHAETSKVKVLEFLAKINNTIPSAFPTHFEEAWKKEEERAQAEAAASPGTNAKGKARSKTKCSQSTH